MESVRSRGRKRHCCCYCNVYFYQVDAWQRHNRKHTGVEIECDDCGEMCSDSFELKSHQQICEAYRVYSEEIFTSRPTDDVQTTNIQKLVSTKLSEDTHDTPDSTSKQESANENDEGGEERRSPSRKNSTSKSDESTRTIRLDSENNDDNSKNAELEELIGEDQGTNRMLEIPDETEDPETEALIGLDQSEVEPAGDNESKPLDNNIGVDTQIVIKVENALNDIKRDYQKLQEEESGNLDSTFMSRPSPNSLGEGNQTMTMENSELNKKYQPYFCKNCGARFTRKDSVTRHLKKGTCSGKSAIVCNICGKVFPEMFELQEHFKLDHKNMMFTPPSVHRSILPKPDPREPLQRYSSYPAPFVLREQRLPPGARPYVSVDPPYRALQAGVQPSVFYAPSGNQSSYRHRNTFSHPSPSSHYRNQSYGSRHYDMKYSPGGLKDEKSMDSKILSHRNDKHNRKRDYVDYQTRDQFHDRVDFNGKVKRRKSEHELDEKSSYKQMEKKQQINLSEYTNNAMNSQQYFNKRFVQKEQSAEKDEPGRMHRCKICTDEFPRFEYLLTHLRKHKEKHEDEGEDSQTNQSEHHGENSFPSQQIPSSLNDSTSSDDSNDHKICPNYNSQSRPTTIYSSTNEPVTIVLPQPPVSYSSTHQNNNYTTQHQGEQIYSSQIPQHNSTGASQEGNMEAITPGVDGKFRPFICENCGQRFTRKDSLVRHAKKQTCFEEQTELKCKHCDKTFRYHKCLIQHQELVHGISREEQSKQMSHHSEDEESDSDKSEKNESYLQSKKETLVHDTKHYNEDKYPSDVKQSTMKREMVESKLSAPTYHMLPHNPLTPLHQRSLYQRPPYHHAHEHPPIPVQKFILPKSDDKVLPHQHEGGASSNQQDTQYIGYCTVPRPFQCEYCGDRFAHRHSLKRHVRRHLGIGIPCHECGKLYRDQSEWRRHQRSIHNRHYEKYEVPNRVSYRDGVESGMIGVVHQNEYNADQEEGSDTDEEEMTMVTNTPDYPNRPIEHNTKRSSQRPTPEASHQNRELVTSSSPPDASTPVKEENEAQEKDDKVKAFNFKSFSVGDKDSRKNALDRYLRSPQSDEEDGMQNISKHNDDEDSKSNSSNISDNNNSDNNNITNDSEEHDLSINSSNNNNNNNNNKVIEIHM